MIANLPSYLADAARKLHQLGTFDCGIFLADWCVARWGVDPIPDLRGRYRTMDEFHALVGSASLPLVFGRRLRAAGFRRVTAPAKGDIAMILDGTGVPCGSIVTAGYVVLAKGGGLSRAYQARLLAAWSR